MTDPMIEANIIKAPGCPHYVLRSKYDAWVLRLGVSAIAAIRCEKCLVFGTPTLYGRFDTPGRVPQPKVSASRQDRRRLGRVA